MSGWFEAEKERKKGSKPSMVAALIFQIAVPLLTLSWLRLIGDNEDSEPELLRWTADPPPAGAVQIKWACVYLLLLAFSLSFISTYSFHLPMWSFFRFSPGLAYSCSVFQIRWSLSLRRAVQHIKRPRIVSLVSVCVYIPMSPQTNKCKINPITKGRFLKSLIC